MLTQSRNAVAADIRAQLLKNCWLKVRRMDYDELIAERKLLLLLLHYEALLDDEVIRFDAIMRELEMREDMYDRIRGVLTTAAVFFLGAHRRNVWGIDLYCFD